MIRVLDRHFCLAVFTSAKRKTARALVDLLLPKDVRDRLLFVWTQKECHPVVRVPSASDHDRLEQEEDEADGNDGSDTGSFNHRHSSVIYEKHLPKVWKAFPLWSADNTLLIDDSPDKCPYFVANAIHPPPLHGQTEDGRSTVAGNNNAGTILSDEKNQQMQTDFFRRLVEFWSRHPYETISSSTTTTTGPSPFPIAANAESGTSSNTTGPNMNVNEKEEMANEKFYTFLETHAGPQMGWRPSKGATIT
mmetsp:Transcript_21064/g.37900  ORF Transcript_21064/g.37900 Transcript_21064/m.37900 type:complete len:249 (-) Transcript_21064:21-767(-)